MRIQLMALLLAALSLSACFGHVQKPVGPPPPTLASVADTLFASIEDEGTTPSVLVVDAETGERLYARNERMRLIPASTMKVVSTAAALSALGAEYRYRTPVRLEGTLLGGLFLGDVTVEASGDPSLGSWRFPESVNVCQQVADALWLRGIRHWQGALRVRSPEEGPFGPFGPGWAWDDAIYAYSAAPTPFSFRENTVDLVLSRAEGQACSAPPTLRVSPAYGKVDAIVQVDTSAPRAGLSCVPVRNAARVRCVWRSPEKECPREASMRMAIADPEALFAGCVAQAVATRGILHVALPEESAAFRSLSTQEPLMEFLSPPLSELVKVTNKESNNLYAERLALSFVQARAGSASYPVLRDVMAAELTRRGIPLRLLRPVDGSGLSRYNQATAQGMVQVLYTSLKEPYAAVLVDSLPVVGVDGTLTTSAVSEATRGRIRAKTGSMSGQRSYVGIAERPGDPAHPRVVFSLMLGNMDDQPTEPGPQVFVQFAEALVHLPLR
jgi:D-alanyl-D-alanine carboxypeptidase/D-alanyl-D-alanine-endopeptidase (penicillin-binding protein 4)